MKKNSFLVLMLLIVGGCAQPSEPAREKLSGNLLVTFSAMGDVPYKSWEDELLVKQVRQIPRECEFVVHLGDIQENQHEKGCNEEKFIRVEKILSRSQRPLFMIPGDNEYNDCFNTDEA